MQSTPHQTNQSLAAIRQKKSVRLNHWHFLHWLQRNWSLKRTERAVDTAVNRGLNPGVCCAICPLSLLWPQGHFTSAKWSLIRATDCQWSTLNLDSLLPSLTAKILPFPDNSSTNLVEKIVKTIPPKSPLSEVKSLVTYSLLLKPILFSIFTKDRMKICKALLVNFRIINCEEKKIQCF